MNPLVESTNALKLGLFCTNGTGASQTLAPERHTSPSWERSVRTAQAAEAAGFETVVPFARWKGYPENRPEHSSGMVMDPFTWAAGIAASTQRIGVLATSHAPTLHPIVAAKQAATIDLISGGRFALNVVGGWNRPELEMFGAPLREHDERYAAGEDFLEAVYKLWEASWTEGAVVHDRRAGKPYTDPSKIRRVLHEGPYFRVDGFNLVEPSPQRTPVLYQAGASGRGKAFAGKHAECVFLEGQTPAIVAAAARDIRKHAVDAGRAPDDVLLYLGATVVVARTSREARALHAEYAEYVDTLGQLVLVSGWTGIDFAAMDLDEPIRYVKSNALQSTVENLTKRAGRPITPRDMTRFDQIGGRGPFIVGDPAEVADQLVAWADETGVDGFNLRRTVMPESLHAFVDLVVPELQNRGRYRTAYADGTLREKLFAGRGPHLRDTHPGARYRAG